MANILGGIAGLAGGLSGGLSDFLKQREIQAEMANRQRLTDLQAQQEKRMMQAQEWEKRKAAYEALNPETDLSVDEMSPFAQDGFKFIKTPEGMFRRAPSVSEQSDMLENQVNMRKIQGRQFLEQHPEILGNYDQMQQIAIKFGLDPKDIPVTMERLRAEAEARFAPQAADNQLDRQNRLQVADINADALRERIDATAMAKPVDQKQFLLWRTRMMQLDPKLREEYNEALSMNVPPAELEKKLLKMYLEQRNPSFE